MKPLRSLILLLASATALLGQEGQNDYQAILEAKYEASLERLKVLDFSEGTKVLGFDFELMGDKSWWGGFNVIEVDDFGAPLYWYDIPRPPTEAGIESLRVVEISGSKCLEVVASSHMGNGRLYLYELRRGALQLMLDCRIMTNLGSMHFTPSTTKIAYRDLDMDGDIDLVINATCFLGPIIGKSEEVVGQYRRVYHFEGESFVEQIGQREGSPELMD